MTQAITYPKVSLAEFLAMPETEPASEYMNGEIVQKPMPKGKHSRLQSALVTAINQVAEADELALAFSELRCTFGGRAIVPDVSVFVWARIPFEDDGEVPNDFAVAPDWVIEILSPEQSPTKPIDKLVHCMQHQTQVGWLIDPEERAVTVFQPGQMISVLRGDDKLPVPSVIPLELTVEGVFGWLRAGRR